MSPETESSQRAEAKFKDALIRSQLKRILESDLFVRSERLSQFLRFVVERSLDGMEDCLKEQVLACELYGRGTEFDAALDPVVRVDARRLRDKLREYYSEAAGEPVVISLPKGSYRPVFDFNAAVPAPSVIEFPSAPPREAPATARRRWMVAALIPLALIAAATTWLGLRTPPSPQGRVAPLSSLPGNEGPPAMSPDGNFVAFSWSDPQNPGPQDIWIKAVDTEARQRLTSTPEDGESNPAWSPDGREIAFVRDRQGLPGGVFIVSVLGAAERKVSDSGTHVGWTADSKSVLIRDRETQDRPHGIFQVFLRTLERRRLTQAPVGIGDWKFDVSPDGSTLAWIRYDRPGIADLYVMPMQGGEPKRLTDWNTLLGGLAWTPDGREIVYSVEDGGSQRLFQVEANRNRPGRGSPIEGIPAEANHPSMSKQGRGAVVRLAFQTRILDIDLMMMNLADPQPDGVIPARPFLPSTRVEGSARFTSDGNRIAFVSWRSGDGEVWAAGRDGSGLRRLTDLRSKELVVGSWSPDGRRIAFTASVDGNTDIYSVADDGGQPLRLTSESSMEFFPSYSADGRWIYFSKVLTGSDVRVWRIPAGGGPAIQITHRGGVQPQESPDGQTLFYLDAIRSLAGVSAPSNLMKVPAGGGVEVTVLAKVPYTAWAVTEEGILFVTREPAFDAVDLYRFRDRTVARVGRMGFRLPGIISHMAWSRDGSRALATQMVRDDRDLMFIDGFR